MIKMFCAVAALIVLPATALAEIGISVTYLQQQVERPPVLSNLDPIPDDLGSAGAKLALEDNLTTAKFLGHVYTLTVTTVSEDEDWITAARKALSDSPFLILDAPASAQLQVADLAEAVGAVLFNASSPELSMREQDCRPNLLHTLPSGLMRTDALAQFLVKRRWQDLVLISGNHPEDQAFADALKRSLQKFRLDLRAEKTWVFDADLRRNAAQEVPLFTQEFGDYDVLLLADELDDFGRYVEFNTWKARPVAGSDGLKPVTWSRVVEQWGAAQMQNRFFEQSGRTMMSKDYAAWAAYRTLGEAVTRTQSDDPGVLRDYILSDEFELAGFKGRAMNFRLWNGQLRQPIPLVTDRAVVAMAPLEGFLHQRTELDTLGIDEAESQCQAFKE
ncbi:MULTISPECIES: ABC transporter substrate-binding protein [unclassified Ruegeria]|uniref:ABC transporter substrate-binding protein n=1 Tax=unclassified Ruegeria TaxID=2625375 RepID=UPI001ADC5583|nr:MULTISPECIES: ABC transporter substrate-binding protein [unclassified Ruegeria]MBO9412308.1 ABC transporter substrate-binding protein [Ruegeria sp. R8_1]MBO9416454.1 ABC transporter substrate-binding protein [Ruegeria sp. R8_2]